MSADPKPAARVKDPIALRRFRLEHISEPCERCQIRMGSEVHHRIFRSQGGSDVDDGTLEWLCLPCHRGIHDGHLDRILL